MTLTNRHWWALWFGALLIRIVGWFFFPQLTSPDVEYYLEAGKELESFGHLIRPRSMPGQPLLFAIFGNSGVRILSILCGATCVPLIGKISLHLFRNHTAAFFSALCFALYPAAIYFSLIPLTETIFLTLILSAFFQLIRGKIIGFSTLSVLAILFRPTFEIIAPLLLVLTMIFYLRIHWIQQIRSIASYFAIYCLCMSPWWIHQSQEYGQFVRTLPTAGAALYVGNVNLQNEGWFLPPTGENHSVSAEAKATSDPLIRDRILLEQFKDYIRTEPALFFRGLLIKTFRLLKPFPDPGGFGKSTLVVIAFTLVYVSLTLLATIGIGAIRARPRSVLLILGFIFAAHCGQHILTIANLRYRFPVEWIVFIFAGLGLAYLFPKLFPELKFCQQTDDQ